MLFERRAQLRFDSVKQESQIEQRPIHFSKRRAQVCDAVFGVGNRLADSVFLHIELGEQPATQARHRAYARSLAEPENCLRRLSSAVQSSVGRCSWMRSSALISKI